MIARSGSESYEGLVAGAAILAEERTRVGGRDGYCADDYCAKSEPH